MHNDTLHSKLANTVTSQLGVILFDCHDWMTGSAVVKGVLSTLVDSMVSHIKMFTSSWKLYLSFVCCILIGGFHSAVGCGGRFTGSSGSISSPNYPGNYDNNLHCTYIIDAGETLITLVFEDFSTMAGADIVEVYDSSNNLLVQLSGDRPGYIVQSAVYYRVVFTTTPWDVRRGFRAVWTVTSSEYARFGGYATLSWTLPDPGTSEFSVCNNETKKCLLHITGYNDVRAASDKFTSRVRFIGHVSSSGTGLFRFLLSDVTWKDEGHYKCYRGSPGSGGPIIPDCGQNLVILGCSGCYTDSSGSISSPNYPDNYGNKLYCTYPSTSLMQERH